jgi:hypothetical protein
MPRRIPVMIVRRKSEATTWVWSQFSRSSGSGVVPRLKIPTIVRAPSRKLFAADGLVERVCVARDGGHAGMLAGEAMCCASTNALRIARPDRQ